MSEEKETAIELKMGVLEQKFDNNVTLIEMRDNLFFDKVTGIITNYAETVKINQERFQDETDRHLIQQDLRITKLEYKVIPKWMFVIGVVVIVLCIWFLNK